MKTLTKCEFTNKIKLPLLALLGIAAGFVNGFLGTGGGIVLMLALSLLPKASNSSVRDSFATLIAVILPLSLISALVYGKSIDLTAASPYLLPGILGGAAGALLLDRINVKLLKKLFALMVIWAGISFFG